MDMSAAMKSLAILARCRVARRNACRRTGCAVRAGRIVRLVRSAFRMGLTIIVSVLVGVAIRVMAVEAKLLEEPLVSPRRQVLGVRARACPRRPKEKLPLQHRPRLKERLQPQHQLRHRQRKRHPHRHHRRVPLPHRSTTP